MKVFVIGGLNESFELNCRAISSEACQKSMLESFDFDDLKFVINVIVTVQQSKSPEWSGKLPFVFVGMLKSPIVAPQHAEVIGAGLIARSCRVQVFSALQQINQRDFTQTLIQHLSRYSACLQNGGLQLPTFASNRVRKVSTRAEQTR